MRGFTPAAASPLSRCRVDVSKKLITAASSHAGAFDTSTTTDAPFSTSASPSPVTVLTPEFGDAAIASCPCSRNLVTSFDPISPLPPITTIFMVASLISTEAFLNWLWSDFGQKSLERLRKAGHQPRSSELLECGQGVSCRCTIRSRTDLFGYALASTKSIGATPERQNAEQTRMVWNQD